MIRTLMPAEDADLFLATEAQRLLSAGFQLVASLREDYGRYEIVLNLADVEVARGDGEDLAEALSHAMILGGL